MSATKTGKFIRTACTLRKITTQELADTLSVSIQTVSSWMDGKVIPEPAQIRKMAELFRCSAADILSGTLSDETYWNQVWYNLSRDIVIPEDSYHIPVDLTFDLESEKVLSPLLCGDNLEHTRDCVNSGISAQMLKNRKFVSKPTRYGHAMSWYPIGNHTAFSLGAPYTCHGEGYRMTRAHECNSQVITNYIKEIGGIGQRDISIQGGENYDFTFVAKGFTDKEVTVSLVNSLGKIHDSHTFQVKAGEFASYSAVLRPNEDNCDARLEITFQGTGTITIGAVSLMPSFNFHGMRWDVIEKMKELGTKLLRWPGGNFAGEYHWKDGFLPRDQRAPFQSWLWLETQPHTLGYDFHEINTDDFIALCREIGAEPFITLNPTWNTPEESAQWVEYCNSDETTPYGALRAQRGNPEPYRVRFWSLGNEFGFGHMEGIQGPYEYAKYLRTYAEKMLAVSPWLTICSSGPHPDRGWADHAAKPLADVAPVVSVHHYSHFPEYIDPALRKQEYYEFINRVSTECIPKLQRTRELLGDNDLQISFDEWNAWYAWYRGGSVSEGIFAATFLNELFRHAESQGVTMACHFESVNEGAMLVKPHCVRMTPTGRAISLMYRHAGGRILALEQDAIATEKDGVLTLTLINRSFDQGKTFRIPAMGECILATVYGSDDVVPNTTFIESELPLTGTEAHAQAVLPAHSLALLQFRLN